MPWGVAAAAVIGGVASNVASNKASGDLKSSSKASRQAVERASTQARADANSLFNQAQGSANQGFQGALDIFGQSVPAQINAFQQGNVNAQQAILAGLPQMQNAILGGNVDLGALQSTQLPTDFGFFNQQLPPLFSSGSDNNLFSTPARAPNQPIEIRRQINDLNRLGVGGGGNSGVNPGLIRREVR